jgi:hypothetical protein
LAVVNRRTKPKGPRCNPIREKDVAHKKASPP